jgi:hypothetical protein
MPLKVPGGRRTKGVDLVDIGFCDGLRLMEVSSRPRHRKKEFLGIETPDKEGKIPNQLGNLELTFGGALKELGALPDSSVKVVNADFLFSGIKHVLADGKVLGAKEMMSRGEYGDQEKRKLVKLGWLIAEEVHRVLKPAGRFLVTEYNANAPIIASILGTAGFECTARELRPDEMQSTSFLKLMSEQPEEFKPNNGAFPPVRITAIKERQ